MGCSGLLILGFVLNMPHCWGALDIVEDVEIKHQVTGILGGYVFLHCQYLGHSDITDASWKRPDSRNKRSLKKLTGYKNNKPFINDPDFSSPVSPTNLTVRLRVSSLEVQGEYCCVFASDEDETVNNMFLTVLAPPDIHAVVTRDTDQATQYQSVTCSAANGKPMAAIGWEINGNPPRDDSCTVVFRNTSYTNGTGTMTSTLRFPTHLQDHDLVTCVVQHPTLPDNLTQVSVRVETYVAPNISIETGLVLEEGKEFWVITCAATGGRPEANITLALAYQTFSLVDAPGTQVRSYHLSTQFHQGENITCLFDHPKFPHRELLTVTLPTFYLSAVRLLNSGLADSRNKSRTVESVVLKEGQINASMRLEVVGNVPRYSIVCIKHEQSHPENWLVTGSDLTLQGPVQLYHAGLYECQASYYSQEASVLLDLTVTPKRKQTAAVPPSMKIDVQDRLGDRFVECLAANSVPVANVSWVLPEGVSGPFWTNVTSNNGTYSVSSVVVLPVCSAHKLHMECVIDHSVLGFPKRIPISLPKCAPPNITLQSSFEWTEGTAFTLVQCTVDSMTSASISWSLGDRDNSTGQLMELQTQIERQPRIHADGSLTTHSVVRFPTARLAGQSLFCVVDHLGLERPERKGILLPVLESPMIHAFVERQKVSPLWLAVCEYRGDGLGAHLTWAQPENATAHISLLSAYEGSRVLTKLTYEFPLALHEGQNLTCLIQTDHGLKDSKTVHVPKYYISSVRVQNQTTPLYRPKGSEPVIHRLALKENLHHQRILLQVTGNVPTYNLTCKSDDLVIQTEGRALLFQSKEWEAGLYICIASFYHHQASVYIQVEVTSEEEQLMILFIVGFSTAAGILTILVVCLCVLCMRNGGELPESKHGSPISSKKRESLSTLTPLTQEPGSPEPRKGTAGVKGGDDGGYAHLLSYSIVIDVRSTV